MSFDDDMRYARARMGAHGFEGGNRRAEWAGPGVGYSETSSETRGPTALEIVLVQKLGGKVTLDSDDFANVREVEVIRRENPRDDSVTLEVRNKSDARGKTITLERQPGGAYGADQYAGL